MATLHILTLGKFQITLGGKPVSRITSDKIQALLAYLAIEDNQPHSREILAELLWPDRPPGIARQNLRQSLARAVRALPTQEGKPAYLLADRESIQLNPQADIRLDWTDFAEALAFTRSHKHRTSHRCRRCASRLEEATSLYRSDFLEGVVTDSAQFEEWALLQREWVRREALGAFYQLTEHYLWHGEKARAYQTARRQVELDPLREEGHQQVMRALAADARQAEALDQFLNLSRFLETELGTDPSPPTTELYRQIKSGAIQLESSQRKHVGIPFQMTPFFERERELTQIAERLDDPGCRLLTLVGLGGVGKSRLAIQCAQEKWDEYRDGLLFIPLAGLASSQQLLPALMAELRIPVISRRRGGLSDQARLLATLQGKQILLVLDNYEHLLPDTSLIQEILTQTPRVQILTTSRQPLDLQAEWLVDISGMAYPPEGTTEPAEKFEAVQFFSQNAARIRLGFTLSPSSTRAVARICQQVAGLPLALELAAALLRKYPPKLIADEIEETLDFLATSRSDIEARHRSLRAVFEQSWRALTKVEQDTLRRLSVFRGGFDKTGALKVLEVEEIILNSLEDQALLRMESKHRFDLQEVIRQYAAEKLAESPELAIKAGQQHSRYFCKYLQRWGLNLAGDAHQQAIEAIRVEIDNIHAAWSWALSNGMIESLAQSLDALCGYYELQGWFQEAEMLLSQYTEVLISLGAQEDPHAAQTATEERLSVLLGRAWGWLGAIGGILSLDPGQTTELLDKSLRILRYFKQYTDLSRFLVRLADLERQSGEFRLAQIRLEESLALARREEEPGLIATALAKMAFLGYLQGEGVAGERYANESLEIFRDIRDQRGEANILSTLGLITTIRSEYKRAERALEASLEIYRAQSDLYQAAAVINNLGLLYYRSGAFEQAEQRFEECQHTFEEMHEPYGVALALYNRGRVAYRRGDYSQAKRLHQEAQAIRQEMGNDYLVGVSALYIGRACLALEDENAGAEYFLHALETTQGSDNVYIHLQILVGIAEIERRRGEYQKALRLLFSVLQHSQVGRTIGDFPAQEEARAMVASLRTKLSSEEVTSVRRAVGETSLEEIIREFIHL